MYNLDTFIPGGGFGGPDTERALKSFSVAECIVKTNKNAKNKFSENSEKQKSQYKINVTHSNNAFAYQYLYQFNQRVKSCL